MKVWAFMSLFANNMRFKSLKSKLILVCKVDFAIRLVNSVFNLPDGQVMFF